MALFTLFILKGLSVFPRFEIQQNLIRRVARVVPFVARNFISKSAELPSVLYI